jgi:hypothetical protein
LKFCIFKWSLPTFKIQMIEWVATFCIRNLSFRKTRAINLKSKIASWWNLTRAMFSQLQSSLCAEMAYELRHAINCRGSTRPATRRRHGRQPPPQPPGGLPLEVDMSGQHFIPLSPYSQHGYVSSSQIKNPFDWIRSFRAKKMSARPAADSTDIRKTTSSQHHHNSHA